MSHIHIPDGVLPFWLWGSGWLLALMLVWVAARLSERSDVRRKVPLLGVVSALMLVAMSTEVVPIAYHINLTVIAGALLGPVLSVIAAFIVQVVLAMLGHGGVTVIGLNTLIVGGEMIVGWALFRGHVRILGKRHVRPADAIATVLALALSTSALVGIVWLGGSAATGRETGSLDPDTLRFENPFSEGAVSIGLFSGGEEHHPEADEGDAHADNLNVKRFATVVYTLGPLGWLLEAFVTASVLGYVARVRPVLVFEGALTDTRHSIPGDETGGR
ncbi:MAG: energy-coupling factor ABC transporter permease [Actinomycetota bacterium]|jgi:cobalt/nickel transport system permease protein|nr:energy-coupling factor ABC transporter permease [Actinomycetota bacterium]